MEPIHLLLVAAISACEAVGQSVAYLARQHRSAPQFLLAWAVYGGVVGLLYVVYGLHGVGYVNALWSGMTTVAMLLIGRFVFGERLARRQWAAIAVILAGMVVLVA
jgi:small multidrug resistance pump